MPRRDHGLPDTGSIAFKVTAVGPLDADIDIIPAGNQNRINMSTPGFVPVAILTTPDLDAADVDVPTVRFGPPGAAGAPPRFFTFVDIDSDGDLDLRLRFRKSRTGFMCGDTEGELTGETLTGRSFVGSDAVVIRQIPPCNRGFSRVRSVRLQTDHTGRSAPSLVRLKPDTTYF